MGIHETFDHTRRAVVAGSIAVAMPLPVLAAPIATTPVQSHRDAEVAAAIARYEAAEQAYQDADDEMIEAYRRCRDLGDVAIPDALYQLPTDPDLGLGQGHMRTMDGRRWYAQGNAEMLRGKLRMREVRRDSTEEEVRRSGFKTGVDKMVSLEPWPEAQARADEIVAAWDWLTAERNARKEASGSFAAERATAAAQAERDWALAALTKVQAKTPHGLQLKAALVASWFEDIEDMDEDIATVDCPTYALALSVLRDIAYRTRPLWENET